MKETFGFAIPCLNGASTLSWTLHSLTEQTADRPQLRLVDSGSVDGSVDVGRRWGIPVLTYPRGNMYRAVDFGLKDLSADFLGYINCDDMLYPDTLERMAQTAANTGADVVYGGCDYIDRFGRLLFSFPPASQRGLGSLLHGSFLPFAQPSAMFRRHVFETLGGFGGEYRHIGDLSFYFRAWQKGFRFAAVPGPAVARYRLHAGQMERREAGVPAEEKARFRAGHPRPLVLQYWIARGFWHARNMRGYAQRWLLRSNLTEMDARALRDHTRPAEIAPPPVE